MKRFLLLAAFLLAVLPASAQMSKLRFRDFEVKSVLPTGFRTVRATVELELVNQGEELELTDVDLAIYRNGKPYVTGKCPSIPVDPGDTVVKAVGAFRLADGVSLFSVLRTLLNINLKEYSADISLTAVDSQGREQDFMLKGFSVAKMARSRRK